MKIVRTLSICTALLWLVTAAAALNPDRDIHQLAHRSWGEKEGYPGRAQALAQTTDGFLWIGSDIGLFRFDGTHFERFVPGSGEKLSEGVVAALLAPRDGSLWIAYRYEYKISVLRNGRVKSYNIAEGVTSNPTAIAQDQEGILWANTPKGLIRFNGTRWEHIGRDWNVPDNAPHATSQALFVDSRGTLWAGVNQTVLYLKRGSKRFEPTGAIAGLSASISEAHDGTIWLSDNLGYVRVISAPASAESAASAKCGMATTTETPQKCYGEDRRVIRISNPRNLLFDRNRNLWITTDSSGLVRVPKLDRLKGGTISMASDALQRFNAKDGLSADSCIPILEDREGNIWVATRDGLDQFRETALVSVALPASIVQTAIAPADGGDIWVAGSANYVARTHGDSSDVSLFPGDAYKPYRDPTGVTWLMGNSLGQWKDGRFRKVADAPYGPAGSLGNWQITSDKLGILWAFFSGHGFFTLVDGRWKAWATPPDVAKRNVSDMFSDSTGRIWVSAFDGGITSMDHGNIVDYPVAPDSPLFSVRAFAEHSAQEIWAGGRGGLVLIERGRFRPVKLAGLDSLKDVYGIVDAGRDGLWLNAAGGVLHISQEEIDRALLDPLYRLQWELFDSSDGLPGQTESIFRYPKAIQGTDGRIWFTALRGVAWIAPKEARRRNAVPPPVHIERIFADRKMYEAASGLQLPAHVRDLAIDYTALSLAVPEKVHFRYKLEPQDPNWREVVNDREVQYSNLPPGNYQFHVIACNNDGVWNETGAILDFSILPAYYQTTWFRLLCVALFAGLLWAVYQLRVRSIQRRSQQLVLINAKLETQIAENAIIYTDLQLQVGLLQRLPVSAWTLKPDGTPDFVNHVWLEFSGQTLDFVRSHPEAWMTAIHPDDRELAAKSFWEGVHSGHGFAFETRSLRTRDGTYRWHLQQAVALRDSEGKVLRFVGTTTDIDDQKRTEEALRQSQGDLARINRVTTMGELTASLAHEISQPISGAITNANVCLRKLGHETPDLEELRVAVTRIVRDGQRAAEILARIRLQFEKGAPKQESLNVNEIIPETVALLRDEAVRHNISVRTELAADLPHIVGDRVQLQQVAMNLIVNSIEAMKDIDGARELVIKSERAENGQILASFTDTGIGLPQQHAEQIFDPFFTTKVHGTGMGLRICRSIVESHGGRLWAEAAAGRGATFHLNLPASLDVPV